MKLSYFPLENLRAGAHKNDDVNSPENKVLHSTVKLYHYTVYTGIIIFYRCLIILYIRILSYITGA